ncbi:ArnT family glycosyltransferase [Enterovirga rhinocerotis]|uniref:4-amino-4-deoxy-L-arabinose transferase-like glycosyltransferase n=1 Tax=Enterovirga rhinocerotis TaxID=1339210 RepID=A0A4R7C955_9HYPH|nr:glycosyltransferase family 39 protein [Enterovirga rhinocerotis]TDR93855.1 4-amino-4-deoxy-L-arabinose transferase-like glycosyltransferase [Enterovirga rhinocerotis]
MPGIAATSQTLSGRATSWSERLLAFIEGSHARAAAALLLLSLVCFLPGFVTLQPMDRDEPRFAQASKQMVETGDYVDIRFQDEPRYKKPIGIHWMQVASVKLAEATGLPEARTTIAVYRVPSLLGALAAVLLTYWAALAFAGRREAFVAAALMATSLILMIEARLAKTDAMLLACCVAAMGALARAWLARGLERQPLSTVVIFWLAIGIGILIKGPMVVMFTGLAALVLSLRERSLRWLGGLRPWLGLVFVLLAVVPWFAAIAWKSGGEFYRLAVGDDMLGKVVEGQQKHGAPPGFYIVAYFATFWPGAIWAVGALPLVLRERREDWACFLIAWVVPAWLIFEAVPTKLPHYVMPLYPALAIATVIAVSRGFSGPWRWGAKLGFGALPLVAIGLTTVVTLGPWWLDGRLPEFGLPLMVAGCLVSLWAWYLFVRAEVTRSLLASIAASVLMSVGVFGLAQPVLDSLRLSGRAAALARTAPCADPAVATLGYREPSLVFLVGTSLEMVESADQAAAFATGPGCRVTIVEERFISDFRDALQKRQVTHLEALGRIRGFNINGGRRQELGLYRVPR